MTEDERFAMPEPAAPSPMTEEPRSIFLPVAAALAAAIAGGVAWGLIVKLTDYEVGIVAWAIGFIAGTAVLLASGGAKGRQLQAIAVVSALLGILLGKYLSYAFAVQEELSELAESVGVEESIGIFSGDMFSFFREDLDAVFGLFDLLWVGLAVFTAWRIPQPDEQPQA